MAKSDHLFEALRSETSTEEARVEGLPDCCIVFGFQAIGEQLFVCLGVQLVKRVGMFFLDILILIQVFVNCHDIFVKMLLFFLVAIFLFELWLSDLILAKFLIFATITVLLSAPAPVLILTVLHLIVLPASEALNGLDIVRLAKLVVLAVNSVVLLFESLVLILTVAANAILLVVSE